MIRPWEGNLARIAETYRVIPPTLEFGGRIETLRKIEKGYSGVEGFAALPNEVMADLHATHAAWTAQNADWLAAGPEFGTRDPPAWALTFQAWTGDFNAWSAFYSGSVRTIQASAREAIESTITSPIRYMATFTIARGINERLEAWKIKIRRWGETFQARTGRAPTSPATPAGSAQSSVSAFLSDWKPVIIGGVVVAGLFAVVALVKSVPGTS